MFEFPASIKKPSSFAQEIEDPALRSTMTDGTVISRAKFTRQRSTFSFGWTALTNDEYKTLINFYRMVKGGSERFTWHNPYDETTYTVRFKSIDKFTFVSPSSWQGSIVLEEA